MISEKQAWQEFTESEIKELTPILKKRNVSLLTEQPHISGERFLMSGQKVVLEAIDKDTDKKIIIKSTTDKEKVDEIMKEREAEKTLSEIPFAYQPLLSPKELWIENDGHRVTVAIEYIEQPKPFLSLPLENQFDLSINAFNMMSAVHVTTSNHLNYVRQFESWGAHRYLATAKSFVEQISTNPFCDKSLAKLLAECLQELEKNKEEIERYCGFLTHDDFVLHNFRFFEDKIYLIDQSALIFGNKHESWARFLNYMLLYNRNLEKAILKYAELNLAPEEQHSIRLMRIYKLIELLKYHFDAAEKSEADVKKLSIRRIKFWELVLQNTLNKQKVSQSDIDKYKIDRDQLRSKEEIERQRVLQQLI